MRHVIVPEDLSAAEIEAIFAVSRDLQEKFAAGRRDALLPGRVLALVFEKPSLRTRVSFEAAMTHLGGSSLFLGEDSGFASSRESIADFGRVLGGYVDAIVCRSKSHDTIRRLAEVARVPVINGLSDLAHPCQALADVYTLRQEIGRVQGLSLAFVGDGNNVARSLAIVCGLLGMRFVLAAPEGYQFDTGFRKHLTAILPDAEIEETTEAAAARGGRRLEASTVVADEHPNPVGAAARGNVDRHMHLLGMTVGTRIEQRLLDDPVDAQRHIGLLRR
jgi:ornithine carbamoyltransferase